VGGSKNKINMAVNLIETYLLQSHQKVPDTYFLGKHNLGKVLADGTCNTANTISHFYLPAPPEGEILERIWFSNANPRATTLPRLAIMSYPFFSSGVLPHLYPTGS
jgi:hypothetical protein